MTKQIEIAMDCSIRRAGVDKSQSAKIMKRWGWARWSFDSQTCELDHMVAARTGGDINYWFSAKEYVDGCWKDTKAFDINVLGCEGAIDDCDASSRVVVLMYNIEHYGGLGNVEFFEKETEFLVKRAVSLGAKVVLATSPPKHFSADGAYSKEAYITKIKSETVCTCTPTVESIDKNPAWRGYFEAIERLSRIPGVLGVIDILRSSMKEFYRSHKGGHCGYYVDEVPGENSQKPKREVKMARPKKAKEMDAMYDAINERIAAKINHDRRNSDAMEMRSFAFDDAVDELRASNLEELEETEKRIARLRLAESEQRLPPTPGAARGSSPAEGMISGRHSIHPTPSAGERPELSSDVDILPLAVEPTMDRVRRVKRATPP